MSIQTGGKKHSRIRGARSATVPALKIHGREDRPVSEGKTRDRARRVDRPPEARGFSARRLADIRRWGLCETCLATKNLVGIHSV